MARKGWDALSEAYRSRLSAGGISQSAYESGASLHGARGHTSQQSESFGRRVARFVETHATGDRPHVAGQEIQAMDSDELARRVKAMGPQQGQQYMDERRKMTRAYERGNYDEARRRYLNRPKGSPAHLWWYHGMFGG